MSVVRLVGLVSARNSRVSWAEGMEPTRSRWTRRKNSASDDVGERAMLADAAACSMGGSIGDWR